MVGVPVKEAFQAFAAETGWVVVIVMVGGGDGWVGGWVDGDSCGAGGDSCSGGDGYDAACVFQTPSRFAPSVLPTLSFHHFFCPLALQTSVHLPSCS